MTTVQPLKLPSISTVPLKKGDITLSPFNDDAHGIIPNSRFPNYNTFDDDAHININADNDGIVFDDFASRYITMHPTQSRFSMYAMQNTQSMYHNQSAATSDTTDRIYSNLGECYRKFCFTEIGMKCMLSVN
eukprot:69394_1